MLRLPFRPSKTDTLGESGADHSIKGLQAPVDEVARAYPDKQITAWFQNEARMGQKGRACHRWWLKEQRPPGLCDR